MYSILLSTGNYSLSIYYMVKIYALLLLNHLILLWDSYPHLSDEETDSWVPMLYC